ncbi:MAG: hypothetical protein PUG60_08045, partial [Lachnospiraceae bacterium]|nr:hypothetical protein [Lachnospiraceae bacterium]
NLRFIKLSWKPSTVQGGFQSRSWCDAGSPTSPAPVFAYLPAQSAAAYPAFPFGFLPFPAINIRLYYIVFFFNMSIG